MPTVLLTVMAVSVVELVELPIDSSPHTATLAAVGCPMNGLPGTQTEARAKLRQLTSTVNATRPVRSRPAHDSSRGVARNLIWVGIN